MAQNPSRSWWAKVFRRPDTWFILIILALITFPHYQEALQQPAFFLDLATLMGLGRHAFERILYLAPIVWAGFIAGWRGAMATSIFALGCMLPRAIFISLYPQKPAALSGLKLFSISRVFVALRFILTQSSKIILPQQLLILNFASKPIQSKDLNAKQCNTLHLYNKGILQST